MGHDLALEVGHRFGASVLRIREGKGGPKWHIEQERLEGSGSKWRYRYAGINEGPYFKSPKFKTRDAFWLALGWKLKNEPDARRRVAALLFSQVAQ